MTTVSATSWGINRLDVFGVGADNMLKHRVWDGSTWTDWENLGGNPYISGGNVAGVTTRGLNSLDVFVIGPDAKMSHKSWNGTAWSQWESLGGAPYFTTGVGAVASN